LCSTEKKLLFLVEMVLLPIPSDPLEEILIGSNLDVLSDQTSNLASREKKDPDYPYIG
jgi:hypothetical protein